MNQIGITERVDPTINLKWVSWVQAEKPAILITKMPRLLLPLLNGEENIIVHCTITGLGGGLVEPKIDPWTISLEYYHYLCNLLGPERVVLRIDPIVYRDYWKEDVLKLLVKGAEGRVRISFLDLYHHVEERFKDANLSLPQEHFHKPLNERLDIWNKLGQPEICGEPGMPNTPCVSLLDCEILGVKPSSTLKGQRRDCGCLANKTELCPWPPKCTYECLYCYWKD